MNFKSKGVLSLALIAAAAFSNAAINYNNIVATVTYDGGTAENLTVIQDGNSITFMPPPMMLVSSIGPHSSAVIDISYDVQTDVAINGINLIFTGLTMGDGQVGYSETVKNNIGGVIASTGNLIFNAGPFVHEELLGFGSVMEYSVEKQFTLSLGLENVDLNGVTPIYSAASIGLIEQNAVPEPATLGAVGVGLFGILARRRRKQN
jgi:hypothetical protein